MKRGKVLMTVLVVLAVLFASCSNGMSKDDGDGAAHSEKVMVSLGVDVEGAVSQKTISADTNLGDLTYWYKAKANWEQDRPIHGETKDNEGNYYFVMIPNYSSGAAPKNLGYFTAGEWTFYVEVRKGEDVIYSGQADHTFYTGNTRLTVTVTADDTGKGAISITVKVPATGGADPEHESLSVTSSEGGVTMKRTGYADGLATYTGTKGNLTPGAYTFWFSYTDEGNSVTEGAAQAVTIFAGQTSYITGTIDGGKWHSGAITINAPGIATYSLTADGGATSVAPSTELEYTCTATSAQGNDLTYQWFINGTNQGAASADNTFSFSNGTCGMYIISCSAIDATAGVTKSESLYVEVGYKVTFSAGTNGTVAYGANSSASTIFAGGDIVSMSVTPNPNYKVSALSPAGQYDDASHTATFYMPAANTNFSVTFAEKAYALTIDGCENGTVETVKADTKYDENDIVKLNVTPASGYHLKTLTMNGNDISASYIPGAPGLPVNPGKASFKMPAGAATVAATFEADPAP